MSRMTASAAQNAALERRKLEERAFFVRGRVEATPGAGLGPKMANVDRNMALLMFAKASTLMDEIDEALADYGRRCQEAEMAAAGQMQDQLLSERGVETYQVGSVRTRDGWTWLVKKRRLSDAQAWAGERYASRYAMANRGAIGSCANDNAGGGTEDSTEAGMKAREELAKVRAHINRATGSDRLSELLDMVCGEGHTLRALAGNDDRKASAKEVELKVALDMAGVAFRARREAA